MTTSCQYCAAPASAERTYCPSCRRRLRPADATAAQPVDAASPPAVEISSPVPAQFGAGQAAPQQSFATALTLAVAVAAGGVVAWVLLAQSMHVRSALVALVVAAGTAAAFRRHAPADRRAPIVIVGLAVASAVVGLLASQYALLADAVHVDYFTVVERLPMSKIPRLMTAGTTPMTWFIVALSIYTGWRYSIRLRQAAQPGRGGPSVRSQSPYPTPQLTAQPPAAAPGVAGLVPEPTPDEEEKWRRFAQSRDD
jgi:hypothetical protein